MTATAIPRMGISSFTYIPPPATKAITSISKPTTFIFSTLNPCRAQLLFQCLLYQLFGFRFIVRVGGKVKKPAPQSYLEVKALVCPK